MSDRLILGLDNSMDFINVVLGIEGRLVEERHSRMERHSSETLPGRIFSLLADHGFAAADLSMLLRYAGARLVHGCKGGPRFRQGAVARAQSSAFRRADPRRPGPSLRVYGRLLPVSPHRRQKGRGLLRPLPRRGGIGGPRRRFSRSKA